MTSKYVWIVAFPLMLVLRCGIAAESGYPFDPNYKAIEDRMEAETAKCKDVKNPMARVQCREDVHDRAKNAADMRGTRPYAEATYKKLETSELEKVRLELIKQQDRARDLQAFSRTNPRPKGELTKEALGVELGVIEDELRRRGRSVDERNRAKWKEITGKDAQ